MKRNLRIVISTLIAVIGMISTYLLGDVIYKIAFLNLELEKWFNLEGIFVTCISVMLVVSAIPAMIYHIRIIRSDNIGKQIRDTDTKTADYHSTKSTLPICFGNILFGVISILLGGQVLRVTIKNQFAGHNDVLYHNYLVSSLILLVGSLIIIDALVSKRQALP